MISFEIKLFGAMEIYRNGALLLNFRSQKALVLLAYLIRAERPITREYLAGLGWPDIDEAQALGLLRRSLHDLNQRLPGCLAIERHTVRFSANAPATVDLRTFANLVDQGEQAAWTRAVALYRAPFLHGVYLADAPELENWLHSEQDYWQSQLVQVLNRLIAAFTAQGEYTRALYYAQQLVTVEPWREETHRQVMLLFARTGQLRAALAQYVRCRQALQAELEVEPAPETEALYRRIKGLTQRSRPKLPASHHLFIGRETELAELMQLLARANLQLITLMGPGGMGKTRLAMEAARALASEHRCLYLDGVVFVSLAGVDTLLQLMLAVAQAVGLTLHSPASAETQLLTYLGDKELLLVLDNFEQFINEHSLTFVRNLLDVAPDVKLLITSRVRLNLQGEQLYWVPGLRYPTLRYLPTDLTLETLNDYSSIQLFIAQAHQAHPDYPFGATDMAALVTICQLVQGMPLALELAAAWLSVLSPAEIATEIRQNLDFLVSEAQNLPLRQRSMRAVFTTSWRLLTSTEQRVFQQLAVFRGGFTRAAAQAVADVEPQVLLSLVHKSFLARTPTERFAIHELVRQFAHEQLFTSGALLATQQRHAAYFLTLAEQAEHDFFTDKKRLWLECLESEHDNLQAVLAWALAEQEIELLLRLAKALRRFWDCRGYHAEMNQWLEQAVALAEQVWGKWPRYAPREAKASLPQRIDLLAQALYARAEAMLDDREQAEALYWQSLALDQRIGPTRTTFDSYLALLWIERRRSNCIRAEAFYQQLLQLIEQLPDFEAQERQRKRGLVLAYWCVHLIFHADLEVGAKLAQEALPLLDSVKDKYWIIHIQGWMGYLALCAADFERADALLTTAYRACSEAGDFDSTVFYRFKLGLLALHRADWRTAQAAFTKNLTWLQAQSRDYDAFVQNLRGLAEVARQQAHFAVAARLLGALARLQASIKYVVMPVYRPDFEATLTATRTALDEVTFTMAYAEGYAMPFEQAVTYALSMV